MLADADFAGLAAIRAVIQAVGAQADAFLPGADTAEPIALALDFRAVANRADNRWHAQNIEKLACPYNARASPRAVTATPFPAEPAAPNLATCICTGLSIECGS